MTRKPPAEIRGIPAGLKEFDMHPDEEQSIEMEKGKLRILWK